MECEAVRKELERGRRLLISDIGALGGDVLNVIDYFDSLPAEWTISYFETSDGFERALEDGAITSNSVVVLPNDEGLVPGSVYSSAVKRGISILIILGAKQRKLVDNRDLPFYVVQ